MNLKLFALGDKSRDCNKEIFVKQAFCYYSLVKLINDFDVNLIRILHLKLLVQMFDKHCVCKCGCGCTA